MICMEFSVPIVNIYGKKKTAKGDYINGNVLRVGEKKEKCVQGAV